MSNRLNFLFTRFAIASITFLVASCQAQQSDTWRDSDPTYVPFPVKEIAAADGNRFVGLTVDERPQSGNQALTADYVVYVRDLKTGAHRRLGMNGDIIPTVNDQFIFVDSDRTSRPPRLINGLDDARIFEIGEHDGGLWNSKTNSVIFEKGWPRDAEGFNVLGLLAPSNGAVVTVKVPQVSELIGLCPATGNFYTEHRFSADELGADEYDGNGKFVRTIHSPLAVYSAACTYALPFAAIGLHGPDDWGVFEASSGTKLIDYPWNEDGKSDLHWFRTWNPSHDNLLLMYSTAAASKMDTIDVLDVVKRSVVKSWPHPEDSAPIEWSGDGEAIVTVRDNHVVFEPFS
jgi:hypothetical protein